MRHERGSCVLDFGAVSWSFVAFGLVWVVGGNFLIHLWMKRVHAGLREELAPSAFLFEEAEVRARYTATALVGFSIRWVRGALAVHDRCVVLYQQGLIAQPPLVFFRSDAEASAMSRRGINKIVLTADPVIDDGAVELVGKRGMVTWKVRITTTRAPKLAAAVRAMRHRESGAAYR